MAWLQGGFSKLQVLLTSSAGEKKVTYNSGTGINGHTGNSVDIYLGTTGSTSWRRFERNIEADYELYAGGATWTNTDGLIIIPDATYGSYDMNVDDIRLSDSVTVEHNTLGPGVIGHILRNTTWDDTSSLAREDKWFHYDQVGSVLSVSDDNGDLAETHQQDAFGNVMASWSGGEWDADAHGWHLNSKQNSNSLSYMFNRWYIPSLGIFSSKSPHRPEDESAYGFATNNPMYMIDPDGRIPVQGGTQEQQDMVRQALSRVCNKTGNLEETLYKIISDYNINKGNRLYSKEQQDRSHACTLNGCLDRMCKKDGAIVIGGSGCKGNWGYRRPPFNTIHVCETAIRYNNRLDPSKGVWDSTDHTIVHEFVHVCGFGNHAMADAVGNLFGTHPDFGNSENYPADY